MENTFRAFLKEHEDKTIGLRKELYIAHWNFETTGKEEWKNKLVDAEKRLLHIYANKDDYRKLKEIKASGEVKDPLLERQLGMLLNSFESEQHDEELIDRIVNIVADINDRYTNFRGLLDGKKVNDNDILEILQESNDNQLRQKAWEASKEIGKEVSGRVLEVVRLRNEAARKLGYENHYQMSLKLGEIDSNELFQTLEKLTQLTDKPYAEEKAKLDKSLAKRFSVDISDLRPWHYADPFFQEAPSHGDVDLDHLFKNKDIVDLNVKFYDGIGLEVRDIIERSDLFPKEGKSQHAFCSDLDREGDIRILCNIMPNEKWTATTLHELGHAVYDKYLDSDLPYFLRTPAHIMSTEAIAMLMGRLTKSERWLIEIADMSEKDYEILHPEIKAQARLAMLIFVRWGLVMVNFERAMYANPEQDLNNLWWDYVEKFQLVKRPENRDQPDWAAKIHLALAPVYYQNYLLGEMIASQLGHYIHLLPGGHITNNPETGIFLKEKYFRIGAKYDWNETLKYATGEVLNPEYFIREFIS